jgi:hypothetical protein
MQEGVCVTTEVETYGELNSQIVTKVHDIRRIGNWFGLDLIRADPSCQEETLPVANSGIIGTRDHQTLSLVGRLVKGLYKHPAHAEYARWFGDQPFLNYVLVKTRLGVYDVLGQSCSFLGFGYPMPKERRGFAHFIWARGEDKQKMMETYLQQLRSEATPAEAVSVYAGEAVIEGGADEA